MEIDKKGEILPHKRMPLEKILKITNELWRDSPEFAHKIGVNAVEIIRHSYLKNHFEFYGKKPSAIVAAAVYPVMNQILSPIDSCKSTKERQGQYRSLVQLAYSCGVGETALRKRAQQLAKLLKKNPRACKKDKRS